ncbi:MAG: hypothetical protein M3495_11305, partial [Pseudomonadota bacterium]|nr:hypothetical protein [Pseudomonadota bacterium]
ARGGEGAFVPAPAGFWVAAATIGDPKAEVVPDAGPVVDVRPHRCPRAPRPRSAAIHPVQGPAFRQRLPGQRDPEESNAAEPG